MVLCQCIRDCAIGACKWGCNRHVRWWAWVGHVTVWQGDGGFGIARTSCGGCNGPHQVRVQVCQAYRVWVVSCNMDRRVILYWRVLGVRSQKTRWGWGWFVGSANMTGAMPMDCWHHCPVDQYWLAHLTVVHCLFRVFTFIHYLIVYFPWAPFLFLCTLLCVLLLADSRPLPMPSLPSLTSLVVSWCSTVVTWQPSCSSRCQRYLNPWRW